MRVSQPVPPTVTHTPRRTQIQVTHRPLKTRAYKLIQTHKWQQTGTRSLTNNHTHGHTETQNMHTRFFT